MIWVPFYIAVAISITIIALLLRVIWLWDRDVKKHTLTIKPIKNDIEVNKIVNTLNELKK